MRGQRDKAGEAAAVVVALWALAAVAPCWAADRSTLTRRPAGTPARRAADAAAPASGPPDAAGPAARRAPAGTVILHEAWFRDKVHGCWLGKSIGGTLGAPLKGKRQASGVAFYDPVPTKAAPNTGLDLQLLWLKALEERGPGLNAGVLGDYWLKHVLSDAGEYGACKRNLRDGFPPPLSGQFRNGQWRDGNGAWIRAEIWACVAPGQPALAARYAFEDACVDHGAGEGTWAAVFVAALESAAFVEPDPDRLIRIALGYVPPDGGLGRSVRAAVEARQGGLGLAAARQAVIDSSRATGWSMAPQNVAFAVLGWLYHGDDFGKALCAGVNCGGETDCTGAGLGAVLGILRGAAGIPADWRRPVGDEIHSTAVGAFEPAKTLTELTDRTLRMARTVLAEHGSPVAIRADGPTTAEAARRLRLVDPEAAAALRARSPYQIVHDLAGIYAKLDYLGDPVIAPNRPRELKLWLENETPWELEVSAAWRVPRGVTAEPASATVKLPPRERGPAVTSVALTWRKGSGGILHGAVRLRLAGAQSVAIVPFALEAVEAGPTTTSPGD